MPIGGWLITGSGAGRTCDAAFDQTTVDLQQRFTFLNRGLVPAPGARDQEDPGEDTRPDLRTEGRVCSSNPQDFLLVALGAPAVEQIALGQETVMSLNKPALEPRTLEPQIGSAYPEPYRSRVLPREKLKLGDALGLSKIGVNLTTLSPGKVSSMRHWHTREDELIYLIEGELVLRTSAGEQLLTAGNAAGFPAGVEDGHQLINRSDRPAIYLEVSNRDADDTAHYSDPEVDMIWSPQHARRQITHRDGTPY